MAFLQHFVKYPYNNLVNIRDGETETKERKKERQESSHYVQQILHISLLQHVSSKRTDFVLLFSDSLVPKNVPGTKHCAFSMYLLSNYIPIL